jgi:hypothetical protein
MELPYSKTLTSYGGHAQKNDSHRENLFLSDPTRKFQGKAKLPMRLKTYEDMQPGEVFLVQVHTKEGTGGGARLTKKAVSLIHVAAQKSYPVAKQMPVYDTCTKNKMQNKHGNMQ